MLHHMALLADHANDRIRREMVFRDHNDLSVGYVKICNFMSDHFFFNSGTVRSVLLTEFTAAATCCHSLCFLLLAIPIPNKTTFRARVKFRFFAFLSPSAMVSEFRQDITLASESVLYADRIHEVICIDHLWLKRGV